MRITADIAMKDTSQGGRKLPFRAGYRPQFYVDPTSGSTSFFIDTIVSGEQVAPGERATVEGVLLAPESLGSPVTTGTEFGLREGGVALGTGIVVQVLPDLESQH